MIEIYDTPTDKPVWQYGLKPNAAHLVADASRNREPHYTELYRKTIPCRGESGAIGPSGIDWNKAIYSAMRIQTRLHSIKADALYGSKYHPIRANELITIDDVEDDNTRKIDPSALDKWYKNVIAVKEKAGK